MSDKPMQESDFHDFSPSVSGDKIPQLILTISRIEKYRLTCARVALELAFFSSMLFSWRTENLWLGFACLFVWAIGDHLLQKHGSFLRPSARDAASRIERIDPRLQGRLSTAVEQVRSDAGFSYMQSRLLREVGALAQTGDWQQCVSAMRFGFASSALRLAQFFAFLAAMLFIFDRSERRSESVTPAPQANAPQANAPESNISVLPGNAEIEKGTRLSVSARLKAFAPDVWLVFQGKEQGLEVSSRIGMGQAVGEPLYGAAVESVETDLEYWVETAFGCSAHYIARVFEYPRLESSHALVLFPKGVEPPDRRFENVRKLTVPEGSSVEWELRFNKPVKTTRLIHKDGVTEDLPLESDGMISRWKLQALRQSLDARLELFDAEGRSAKSPVEFRVQVLPNGPAKIRPLLPRSEARFTMLEEVDFEAEVWDDSGLLRWGVSIQLGKGQAQELVLGTGAIGGQKIRMHRLEALEEKGLKVGDSVSWFFWAEDSDGAGNVRRTESDLYLGRIRAFEEEYRQDDSEEQEGKGSGGPQLLELQKQVIAATWNVKRGLGVSEKLNTEAEKNLGVVGASELRVLELAQEKAESENNDARLVYYREAIGHLKNAVSELQGSVSEVARIPVAIDAERAAYDALAHVAPSSYIMKQSRKPNAGKMQERTSQMNNLDFAKQEDRYQSKSEPMSEKEQKQRSQMEELLAQLRSLARRQDEVLERMREMESRLRESTDDKEREAKRRELKKLSDEQRALAQQLEDAQQKAAQTNEALAQQAQEMDAARQSAQRAAAALEKGELDEARASAARSAEKLRAGGDALRQQLSGRTREAARELQERVQELVAEEKKIAGALGIQKKGASRLSEEGVGKEVDAQRKRLKVLQEEMQRAAEATEVSEPLFSKALQDAHRSTVQNQIEQKLKVVEDALAARRQDVALRAEKSASDDVQELARAVEKAADEVLGNDAQALRQARAAVEKIARELSEKSGVAIRSQGSRTPKPEISAPESSDEKRNPQDEAILGDSGAGSDGKKTAPPGRSGSMRTEVSRGPFGEQQERLAGNRAENGAKAGIGSSDAVSNRNEAPQASAASAGVKNQVDGRHNVGSHGKGEQSGDDSQSGVASSTEGQGSDPKSARLASGDNANGAGVRMEGTSQAPSNAAAAGASKDTAGKLNHDGIANGMPTTDDAVRSAGGNSVEERNAGVSGVHTAGGWGVPAQDLGDWLNRLDRVDALLERPQLRAGVARVQQAAEALRVEMKRNASKPSQHQIQQNLMIPLTELRDAIAAELARREGRDNEAPVDRDPVPRKYEASVRRYYEALGGGK
jgi:hypothetical protein